MTEKSAMMTAHDHPLCSRGLHYSVYLHEEGLSHDYLIIGIKNVGNYGLRLLGGRQPL